MAHQSQETLGQSIGGVIVNHRAHEGKRIITRRANNQAVSNAFDFADQDIGHRILYNQAPCRRAFLPTRLKGGARNLNRARVKIRHVPCNNRIIAANIKRQRLIRSAAQLFMQG